VVLAVAEAGGTVCTTAITGLEDDAVAEAAGEVISTLPDAAPAGTSTDTSAISITAASPRDA
jgi:hypothetical protein